MDKNMTLEKRIEAELYCYQGKMSVFVDDLQGHTVCCLQILPVR